MVHLYSAANIVKNNTSGQIPFPCDSLKVLLRAGVDPLNGGGMWTFKERISSWDDAKEIVQQWEKGRMQAPVFPAQPQAVVFPPSVTVASVDTVSTNIVVAMPPAPSCRTNSIKTIELRECIQNRPYDAARA